MHSELFNQMRIKRPAGVPLNYKPYTRRVEAVHAESYPLLNLYPILSIKSTSNDSHRFPRIVVSGAGASGGASESKSRNRWAWNLVDVTLLRCLCDEPRMNRYFPEMDTRESQLVQPSRLSHAFSRLDLWLCTCQKGEGACTKHESHATVPCSSHMHPGNLFHGLHTKRRSTLGQRWGLSGPNAYPRPRYAGSGVC